MACGRVLHLGLLCVLATAPCGGVELELSPAILPGGEFSFTETFSEELAQLPFVRRAEHIRTVPTLHYLVHVDLEEIKLVGKYQPPIVLYNLYVEPRPVGSGPPTAFTFTGRGIGRFMPQTAEVKFFVGEADPFERGEIELPIFSFETPGYVTIPSREESEVVEIDVPGSRQISLPLKNETRFPVSIRVRQPSHSKLWRKVALQIQDSSDPERFEIGPSAELSDRLTLEMVPNSMHALSDVLFPKPDELREIRASLVYNTRWGLESDLPIRVAVRIVPWWPLAFLAVALGALFGSVIPVAAGNRNLKRWPRALLISLLSAVAAELLAMFLFVLKTEVRLFGVTLDPFQLLPALVLGLLAGLLGFRSLDLIRELVPEPFRTRIGGP